MTETEWPIYIITLRGAAKRQTQCTNAMKRLGLHFEFFDAVEGAKLSSEEIKSIYDVHGNARLYKHPLSLPEIGCYLSHFELWKRIASGNENGAFLFEDDFQPQPGFINVVRAISHANLENCMVKLHACHLSHGSDIGKLPNGYKLIMPHHIPGMTLGYAIDKVAAIKLAAQALPITRPVDMEIKHWWKFDLPVLVVTPSLLHVNLPETGSMIEASRIKSKPRGLLNSITRVGRNLRYQIAYNIGIWQHRMREHKHACRLKLLLQDRIKASATWSNNA